MANLTIRFILMIITYIDLFNLSIISIFPLQKTSTFLLSLVSSGGAHNIFKGYAAYLFKHKSIFKARLREGSKLGEFREHISASWEVDVD